jgi:hypothetical protein
MKHSTTFVIAAPLERVAQVMQSPAYHIQEGNSREIVLETQFTLVQSNDKQIRFDVRFVEYKRTALGGIDRSGTTESWSRCTWNHQENSMFWRYEGPESGRVSMSGTYRFRALGSQTQVVHDVDIEVRVPLIGNRIAKVIIQELEKEMPRVQRVLGEHAAES